MKIKLNQFILITFVLPIIMLAYNNCGVYDSKNNELSYEEYSQTVFQSSLQPVLVAKCAACHGDFQEPMFAVKDTTAAHTTIMDNKLVDLTAPTSSYFIQKINSGHNSFTQIDASEISEQISVWSDAMKDFQAELPSRDEEVSIEFEAASVSSILQKTKKLATGGSLTKDEWEAFGNNTSIRPADLKKLIANWVNTTEGQKQMSFYLYIALRQNVTLGNDSDVIFSRVRNSNFQNSLRESMVRTVMDIVESERSFKEVATTSRFAVNSALLSAFAYMEADEKPKSGVYKDFIDDDMNESDFTDWRFVTFELGSSRTNKTYDDMSYWRNIKNESRLSMGIPRTGYFSTLAFQSKFPTNVDNQYRVITNEAVIAGLGKTFSPTDNTNQPLLVGIPEEHAKVGTSCYGCHRSMDPMRLSFGFNMTTDYRYKAPEINKVASFAFDGYTQELNELEDLGSAIANHPNFAKAWVQKICKTFNTTNCVESDSNFLSVVDRFKSNNFNFKDMYVDLLASNLITGAEKSKTFENVEFVVSRSRKTLFCQSLEVKRRTIQQERGLTLSSDFDGGDSLCNNSRLRNSVAALGDDTSVRGSTEVINYFPVDTFSEQAFEVTCYNYARLLFNNNSGLSTSQNNLEESIDLLTRIVAGLPVGHPRHDLMRTALMNTYENAKNTLDMSYRDAMYEAITLACTSPDSTGVGL